MFEPRAAQGLEGIPAVFADASRSLRPCRCNRDGGCLGGPDSRRARGERRNFERFPTPVRWS